VINKDALKSPNSDVYIFYLLDMFYAHKHSIKQCSNTSIV